MNREEILSGIENLLRLHQDAIRDSFHQEPYKGEFFEYFIEAYNSGFLQQGCSGYLGADALSDALMVRLSESPNQDTLKHLCSAWVEWQYVTDNMPQK